MIIWSELKAECPVDITDICNKAVKIGYSLTLRDPDDLERYALEIQEAKASFENIIVLIQSKFTEINQMKTKADYLIGFKLQEDMGRILKRLDDMEKETKATENNILSLSSYANTVRSNLHNIYYAIKNAIELEPKDPRRFLYALYNMICLSFGAIGSISRSANIKKMGATDFIPSYTKLLEPEQQQSLEKEYDERDTALIKELEKSEKTLMPDKN